MLEFDKVVVVASLPQIDSLVFLSDSQDTESICNDIGDIAQEYDSFFVIVGEGEYTAIWGMYGIVPWLDRPVYRLV